MPPKNDLPVRWWQYWRWEYDTVTKVGAYAGAIASTLWLVCSALSFPFLP